MSISEKNPAIAYIPLTRGKTAIVDAEDYEWLSKWKWYASNMGDGYWYAHRQFRDPAKKNRRGRSKQTLVIMHREITGAPVGQDVDHVNHNGLDNRKANLRFCAHCQNLWNQRSKKRGYKGVYQQGRRWVVGLSYKGEKIRLGSFANEMTAALHYDRLAKLLFGEFACLNFPENSEVRK
jgi:hypothetical protein